jgi:Protein of unknown function (DUF2975)
MNDLSAPSPRDWLLTSARWLVTTMIVVLCLAGLLLLAAAIATPLAQDWLSAEVLAKIGRPLTTKEVLSAELFFALAGVIGFLAFCWLRQLRRIIDSVGQGDAFTLMNAERLANMGWLTVGIEAISIPGGTTAHYLSQQLDRQDIGMGFSLEGILLALVLFILARVFREGAAMREELEGTV